MAERLQREFSLPVVKVHLSTDQRTPEVRCELVVNVDDQQQIDAQRSWPITAFGFGDRDRSSRSERELGVPADLAEWVGEWAQGRLDPEAVLWLHLVKPYGPLGAVPWERDIQPQCVIPMLRLPDVLPKPEPPRSRFRLALCATAPHAEGPSTAAQMGPEIARRIAEGVGGGLELHVFGDREAHAMLEGELAGLPNPVTVYTPPDDFEDRWQQQGGSRNRWLWWIRDAMARRSLDAVHFIVHGISHGEQGAILTPWSPTDEYRDTPQHVTVREVREFSNAVGAGILGFTAPDNNYSDFGLRRFVDELGARRAGPVLLHDPRIDMPGLGAAYAFLTGDGPMQPPRNNGLILYAQPRQVGGQFEPQTPEYEFVSHALAPSAAVAAHFERENTPAWLAAAERYLDEKQADLLRFERAKRQRSVSRAQEEYYAGVREALQRVRTVIDRHAEQSL